MDDDALKKSFDELEKTQSVGRIRNRITVLKGIVVSGTRRLTAEEQKELGSLEDELATLTGDNRQH